VVKPLARCVTRMGEVRNVNKILIEERRIRVK